MNAARVAEVPVLFDEEGRTWADVQRRIASRVRRNFPRLDSYMREDAVQEAMVDLFTYWRKLPSAQRNNALTFNFAVQRGCWTAFNYLGTELRRVTDVELHGHGTQAPMDNIAWSNDYESRTGMDDINPDDEDLSDTAWDMVDPSPGPEELYILAEEQGELHDVLAKLSHEDLADVMELVASGKSLRELAAEMGVSHMTVSRRQKSAARKLQAAACDTGLLRV